MERCWSGGVEFAKWLDAAEVSAVLTFSPKGDLLISAAGMIFMMDSTGEHLVRTLEAYNGNTDLT